MKLYLYEIVEKTEHGKTQRNRQRDQRKRRGFDRADYDGGQQENYAAHCRSARFVLVLSDVSEHGLPRFQPSERPDRKRRDDESAHGGKQEIYKQQYAGFHLTCPHLRAVSKSLYGTFLPRMSR